MVRMRNARAARFSICLSCCAVFLSMVLMVSCTTRDVELSDQVQAIMTYEFPDSREPLSVVEDMVRDTADNPAMRENLERQFAQVLRNPDATLDCKDFICRQLWVIGTDISLPELDDMLYDTATADMARYALATNESPNAGLVLRDALNTTDGEVLIGIINTLGERREQKSRTALELFLEHDDMAVATAAQVACEKIDGIR